METTRQQKVARQIQKDIGDILTKEAASLLHGALVSVTVVRMSPDLGAARIFLSIFPFERSGEIIAIMEKNKGLIRKALGGRVRNQLRQVPELIFKIDDSLEYIEHIDKLLK